jgi:hypothetical protein
MASYVIFEYSISLVAENPPRSLWKLEMGPLCIMINGILNFNCNIPLTRIQVQCCASYLGIAADIFLRSACAAAALILMRYLMSDTLRGSF